jgi:hypothetical protein
MSQDRCLPNVDFNPEPPVFEAGVLMARLRLSVEVMRKEFHQHRNVLKLVSYLCIFSTVAHFYWPKAMDSERTAELTLKVFSTSFAFLAPEGSGLRKWQKQKGIGSGDMSLPRQTRVWP